MTLDLLSLQQIQYFPLLEEELSLYFEDEKFALQKLLLH